MQEQQRALARLMNTATSEDEIASGRVSDGDLCRAFLCSYCPHDLLFNNKEHAGACPQVHDREAREAFLQHQLEDSKNGLHPYEFVTLKQLRRFVKSRDKLIEKRKKWGSKTAREEVGENAECRGADVESEDGYNELAKLEVQIPALMSEVEKLGSQGMVNEAQEVYARALKLGRKLKCFRSVVTATTGAIGYAPYRKQVDKGRDFHPAIMTTCEVCGGRVDANGTLAVVTRHNEGKAHQAWETIRSEVARLEEKARNGSKNKKGLCDPHSTSISTKSAFTHARLQPTPARATGDTEGSRSQRSRSRRHRRYHSYQRSRSRHARASDHRPSDADSLGSPSYGTADEAQARIKASDATSEGQARDASV